MGGGVADGDEEVGVVEALLEGFFEVDDGFAEVVVENFDVVPRDFGAEAGAEGLDNGFFGGEAARKVGDGVFEFIAVVLFALGEEAVEEMKAVPVDALAHPFDFDDVVA